MKHRNLLVMLSIIMLLIVTACSESTTATSDQTTPETLDEITLQLSWIHEYSVAQFHNADKNGHFAEQGLAVTMPEGGFSSEGTVDPIEEVLNGNAQFGTGDGSNVLLARQQGKPIVAILSTLYHSPNAVISLEGNGITRPQDMVGKTVAVAEGGADRIYYHLLTTQGIDPESINMVPRTSYGIEPLVDGEVDAFLGWIINEAVMIEEAGLTPVTIAMSDYAVDTYNSLIFTTEDMVENNPELVQRFVDAVTAGMQDILDDPEATIDNTLLYGDELDRDAQLRRLNSMIPLMNVTGLPLGGMQPDVWELTHQMLLDGGVIEEPMDWESAYTTQFIRDEQ